MKRGLYAAGLLAGLTAVAAIGYGIIRNNKTGLADKVAAQVESAVAPLVAAVDVAYNSDGEPIGARPVVLTLNNEVVGYAEPHPLSQVESAHAFVKGVPSEQFLGCSSMSRHLIGQFVCLDPGGIRMVHLDRRTNSFTKELVFVANEDCRTSMSFANELKTPTTGKPQYVGFGGHRMVCVERGGGFGGRGFVNYNLNSLQGPIIWTSQAPDWRQRSYILGDSTAAILSQAVLVGLEVGCNGTTGSGGGWQVQCGGTWKF